MPLFKKKKKITKKKGLQKFNRAVLSLSQLLRRHKPQSRYPYRIQQTPIKPIIPPKSFVIILKDKPKKATTYNQRIIDYKHCGLLQRYIGLGGKILPRQQTKLTAKEQRYIAKNIKSARIMALLPFVSKEKGFFR
jgi:small subunit ribosomal protein S18